MSGPVDLEEGRRLAARLEHGYGPGDAWLDEWSDWAAENAEALISRVRELEAGSAPSLGPSEGWRFSASTRQRFATAQAELRVARFDVPISLLSEDPGSVAELLSQVLVLGASHLYPPFGVIRYFACSPLFPRSGFVMGLQEEPLVVGLDRHDGRLVFEVNGRILGVGAVG